MSKYDEAVDIGYLHDWYQSSVYGEPVWTDEHLKELVHDFYLIPKQENNCATYSTNEKWVDDYIKQFGCEPSFF